MNKKGITRRNFLRLSATMGAGVLVLPEVVANVSTQSEMPKRKLGRTGIELPILSMGVMRADNPNLIRAAYSNNIFHFDTAHFYQNGKNEEMLGNFFKDKPRESFFISTKVRSGYPLADNYEEELNAKLDQSLQRLHVDYVDIFYTQDIRVSEAITDPRVINALEKIRKSGKAKYIGLATHAQKPEILDAAIEAGIYDVALLSYNFKLANLKETQDAMKRAAKAGIGLIAMKTMSGAVEDASGKKKINAGACLKWVWENPAVTTIIPGFANYDELDECVAAVQDRKLSDGERDYLAELCGKDSLFCQQCNQCITQCPQNLPIPDIMRAYIYTYGYKQSQLTKQTLSELTLNTNACDECAECQIKCSSGFNVKDKIAAILPVREIPDIFLT